MNLADLKKLIQKNVEGVHVSTMTESELTTSTDFIKTPNLDLNRILSGNLFGGIQNRNLVGITGPEHSMKSSYMVLCMVEAINHGYTPVIIDTEGGVKNEFASRWGLDLSKVLYIYTPWISKIQSVLASLKNSGDKKFIIGLDSVGGIDKYGAYESALGDDPKADQGQLQRQIRSMLKLFLNICIEQDSIGIVTSHLYSRPGPVPMPDEISGGKAMRLFPSILIQLKKSYIKDANKNIIGNEISATTIKNRMYPPFQTATISIDYINGINPYSGILNLGITAGLVEKSGSWYSYKGEKLGQGEINATKAIGKFPSLLEELNEWLGKTRYSNVNEEIKRIEENINTDVISDENQVTYKLDKDVVFEEEEKTKTPKRGKK